MPQACLKFFYLKLNSKIPVPEDIYLPAVLSSADNAHVRGAYHKVNVYCGVVELLPLASKPGLKPDGSWRSRL